MGTRSGLQGPCPGQEKQSRNIGIRGEEKAKGQMKNKTRRPEKIGKDEEGGITREGKKMNN